MGIPGNVFSKSGLPLSHFAATLPTLTYLIAVGPRLFFKADFPTSMFLLDTSTIINFGTFPKIANVRKLKKGNFGKIL